MLLLCTANQCRSPMAEVLLRHHLAEVGADVRVSSAGLLPGGRPATEHGRSLMAERGLDLSAHVSSQVDRGRIRDADLVLGMAREHVREVAVLDPGSLARTFTLKELVRDASAVGPRHADERLDAWLERVSARRRRDALMGVGHDEAYDVADPIGRDRADYDATARELDHLLAVVVSLAWPSATSHGQEKSA